MLEAATTRRSLAWPLIAVLGWIFAAVLSHAAASIDGSETIRIGAPRKPAPAPQSIAIDYCNERQLEGERQHLLLELAAQRKRHSQELESLRGAFEREQDRTAKLSRQLEVVRKRTWQLPPPAPAAPSPPKKARAQIKVSRGPKVQLIGSDAFVTGTLKNSGTVGATVGVELELVVDRRPYDRTYLRFFIPAGSSVPFSHSFPTMLDDGTYAARATLDY